MKVKEFFKRFIAGLGIGAGAAIPGVSGAAIAVIFKVYEDIIFAINNFRKKFGYALKVLIPIMLGIAIAVIACIYIFSLAFQYLMFVLICIFAGFLVGSFPGVTDEVKGVKITEKYKLLIALGALFVILLGLASVLPGLFGATIDLNSSFDEMPYWLYLVLIPVGFVAAVALTVPGLSGSLILLILGFYRPLVDHAKGWASELLKGDISHIWQLIGMIGCFGVGCLLGVIVVGKIMSKLLEKHHNGTYFAIIGFIIGSLFVLFFNHDIVQYYMVWGGATIENVTPIIPLYIEIPIGLLVAVASTIGSYQLVKANRKK